MGLAGRKKRHARIALLHRRAWDALRRTGHRENAAEDHQAGNHSTGTLASRNHRRDLVVGGQ